MTTRVRERKMADPTDEDWERFIEAMERVKEGKTNPGHRNRPGCRFPHCSCNRPWLKCGDEIRR